MSFFVVMTIIYNWSVLKILTFVICSIALLIHSFKNLAKLVETFGRVVNSNLIITLNLVQLQFQKNRKLFFFTVPTYRRIFNLIITNFQFSGATILTIVFEILIKFIAYLHWMNMYEFERCSIICLHIEYK